jgi:RHS repeat-associated protein
MRLEFNFANNAWHNTLYMPDGSRYLDLGFTTVTYIDRNGNKMSFSTSTGQWTDTLGRSITKPLVTPTVGTRTVNYPGMTGGSSQQVQFVWAKLDTQQSTLYYLSPYSCNATTTTAIPSGGLPLFTGSWGGNPRACGLQTTFDPIVMTELILPNGAKYKFHYNVYAEIDRVDYPTGGYERFVYGQLPPLASNGKGGYDQFNRGVTDRYVSPDGTSGSEIHWHYAVQRESTGLTTGPYHVKTYAPDGTWSEQYLFENWDTHSDPFDQYGLKNTDNVGSAYETRVYDNTTNNTLLRRTLTSWTNTGPVTVGGVAGITGASRDWRPVKEISIIFEPGASAALATMSETVYDTSGSTDLGQFSSLNVKQSKTYKYKVVSLSTAQTGSFATISALFSSSDVAAVSESDYLYDANYEARGIVGLVSESRVLDPANGNGVTAKRHIYYDEGSYSVISAGTDTQWVDPLTAYRANPTTVRSWTDISGNQYVDTHAQFDNFGNLRNTWDARGNETQTDYSSTYNYAYPTGVTTPVPDSTGVNGSNTAFTTSVVYDFNTGLATSATDANGQTSYMEYDDDLLRPTKVTAPNGQQTTTDYGTPDVNGVYQSTQRFVHTKAQIDATNWKEAYAWADGLGRAVKSQSVDTAGDVFVDTEYDNMGRVKRTTNPYRSGDTIYWTANTYDDLGRVTAVTTPDNAVVNTAYSLATTGSQIGTVVTVTDQAGKLRRSVTNALGQLLRVDEPNDAGALGNIDTPNQPTYYAYDTLNNLITVTQGAQTRTFTYNSLSRLLSAANPESGTISYQYDANGNLTSKTDARSITTTYTYDALNRVKTRTYSDSTPAVTYYYDNLTNAKGKLIKVSSSVSTTEYTSFDTMGRVLAHKQTTDGTAYNTSYTYNLSGALLEETYPSGRKVRNTLNANGDLSLVETQPSGGSYATRASNFAYTAAGAISSMQLGNGRWESTQFNSRLQPTQIALGTTQNSTDQLKLNYDYGTTANNGNVQSQTITVPGMAYPLIQAYSYDTLNRLKSAEEKSNGSTTWKQTFLFDRYGNRNFDVANTTTLGSCSQAQCNPTVSATNNRFVSGQGYSYDSAGSVTLDAEGRQFTYDAENKQTQVKDVNNSVVGTYSYDGDGKRVKKVATTESVVFVYDAPGKLVEEYSGGTVQTAYVYAGTRLLTTESPAGTNYLTSDHLGSPRINTDQNGSVTARHDYMPFGEEVFSVGGRTTGLGYNSDNVRKKFTGYERDIESELDFTQARFYNSAHGRFTSTDLIIISDGQVSNPQGWNLYAYVGNNPLAFTDPTGMERVRLGQHTDEEIKKRLKVVNEEIDRIGKIKNKTEDLKKEQDKLKAERTTLGIEKEGNEVVSSLLKSLDSKSELNGLKLSDFTVSTDSRNDFNDEPKISDDPGKGAAAFVLNGYSREIFINTRSSDYALWKSGGPDAVLYGGTALRHEQVHRDNYPRGDSSEQAAYTEQLRILQKYGPGAFKSKEFYDAVIDHVTKGTRIKEKK